MRKRNTKSTIELIKESLHFLMLESELLLLCAWFIFHKVQSLISKRFAHTLNLLLPYTTVAYIVVM